MDMKQYALELKGFGHIIENASMENFTTFKAGGPADLLIFPRSTEDAASIIRWTRANGMPLTVIGGGSNLLVGDRGIRGVVMRISDDGPAKPGARIEGDLIHCDAALSKEDFVEFAVSNGYGDVEFMAGIPGCVGGGILMNAGTFMGNFIDILKTIEYIDTEGNIRKINAERSMAHYRGLDIPDCAVVTAAQFSLPKGDETEMRNKIAAIIAERHVKHPWTSPSAGSVFKNPEGYFSWKLVNDAGLKGYKIGGAQVSELHTNFIINADHAKGSDIKALIEHVQAAVHAKFNVDLHTEVRIIGEF